MIPGYRKIPLSRVMSALCHVMCDYCNFKCDQCLAKRKDLLRDLILKNLKPVE